MSRKKVKKAWPTGQNTTPEPPVGLEDIDASIREYPDEYVVNSERGGNMYGQALRKLVYRFRRAMMRDPRAAESLMSIYGKPAEGQRPTPEFFAEAVIHKMIVDLASTIPVNEHRQPLDLDEFAVICGTAAGMSAAAALDRGEASLIQCEQLTDAFYVGLREGLPRGILLTRSIDAARK